MATPPKYPLSPLLEHRQRRVDDATAELGRAVRTRETAETAEARAATSEAEAEARAAEVRSAEAERLGRGEIRAVDLAQAAAWEVAAREEARALEDARLRAEQQADEARGGEGVARVGVAQAKAEHDVVVKDRSAFERRHAQAAEKKEEEEAEEAFRVKPR